ncbi:MAG: hypothetical protein JWQ90_733 [Hydrocarboniphaga sp.]|uniref:ABC transporter permease n=1 Tax=Hydrocarboniphaga sp. TaxID=2033016 RepID=UPI002627D501|nr:ABC transporter permease [Hydrocarboniphaga sp.]MDB5968283.1 hypothetical protein [Hydrocarboniphaga sp.]
MTASWHKVFRDFWQQRTHTVLVVLAVALGITTFFAVLSSYAIVTRALNDGYRATNPASATLYVDGSDGGDGIDEPLLAAIKADPALSEIEARRTVSGRIKAGPGAWQNLLLFVVKDFGNIRVSTLQPQQGAWPPATGEILIERDAFQVVNARLGDDVSVETADGVLHQLRVSGSVKDVGQAQARMDRVVYGYITLDTLQTLLPQGQVAKLDQLKIRVAQNTGDEAHIRSVVQQLQQRIEQSGYSVRRIDIPTPGEHPHAAVMGMLLLAIAAFGFFVLMLSGVLVVNLMTALMAAQIRQIGVMKALGGSRAQIARIYLAQALCLGGIALVLALPSGLLGSRVLSRYLAVFLNFDIDSFEVPFWVCLLAIVVGLLVPLLAAACPVWNSSRISVHRALTDEGVSSRAFGETAFDRAVAGWSGASRPLLLALRNGFRRRGRLLRTLLTLAVGGLFFMTALNVRASLSGALDRLFESRHYDLTATLDTMAPLEDIARAVRNTPGVVRAEGWITSEAELESGRVTLIALPAGTDLLKFDVVSGCGLHAGDTNALVVNNALAREQPQMRVGNTVALKMAELGLVQWRVVGITPEPFVPAMAYVPKAYFESLRSKIAMANSINLVLQRSDARAIDALKTELDQALEHQGLRALRMVSKADRRLGFDEHMRIIYAFLIVMSCVIGGVGGLGLMTTMSLNVLERRREMGILRALGASSSLVWLIVVTEAALIGLMSWALAALAAWPLSLGLGKLLAERLKNGLDFSFDLTGLWVWLAVVLALSLSASFVPAWRASRCSVREAVG